MAVLTQVRCVALGGFIRVSSCASVGDTDGGRVTFTQIEPRLTLVGKNSPPIWDAPKLSTSATQRRTDDPARAH
jgi:hypothetical protein